MKRGTPLRLTAIKEARVTRVYTPCKTPCKLGIETTARETNVKTTRLRMEERTGYEIMGIPETATTRL